MPGSTLLRYTAPAARWTDALPLGNGRTGAMCFGGTRTDRIQVNDDTCWSGSPATSLGSPQIRAGQGPTVLAAVRAALDAGDVPAAEREVQRLQHGHSQSYQPLVDLWLEDERADQVEGYARSLDLREAVAAHRWTLAGTAVHQEAFVSAPAGALVVRRWAEGPGGIDVTVRVSSPHPTATVTVVGNQVLVSERMPHEVVPPHEDVPGTVQYDGGTAVTAAVGLRVVTDGTVTPCDDGFAVRGAQSVVVLCVTDTDYAGAQSTPHGDVETLTSNLATRLERLAEADPAHLRAEHVADHRSLFDRFSLELGGGDQRAHLPTDERLRRNEADGRDYGLVALLVHYGRYLTIAGSRPGSLPLNLQGIWNESVRPVWSSNYTTNINLEMNYWLAEPANLAECARPLHAWLADLATTGAQTALELYGAQGWVAHHNSDAWAYSLPAGEGDSDPAWAAWPMAGPWLCMHLWEHYAFTLDHEFLAEQAWPLMRGSALFVLDWLVERPDGSLGTSPSTSPENKYLLPGGGSAALSVSTTSDIALVRDLLGHCVEAIDVLHGRVEQDGSLRARLVSALSRLPGYRVLADGRLAEWSSDELEAEPTHRHTSHLIGLHPGAQVDPLRTPDLAEAARASLAARGSRSTGWSLAWRLCLHARLRDAPAAVDALRAFMMPMAPDAPEVPSMTAPAGLYRNLFCAHPPFQLDGNFGIAAGVLEMLVQSQSGELDLLPSLPAEWSEGSVHGLRARGGISVDLTWSGGSLTSVRLVADGAATVWVRSGEERIQVDLPAGEPVVLREADFIALGV